MPRHDDYETSERADGSFRDQPHSTSAHFGGRGSHEERNNNRSHPPQGSDWRRGQVAHNNNGARHNPSSHPYHQQERPQQHQQQQPQHQHQQQDSRSANNDNRLGRRFGHAQHNTHSPEGRTSSPRRSVHDDYDHHRTKRIRSPDNHTNNIDGDDFQQPSRLFHQRRAPPSQEGFRSNSTIPTGPASHQRRVLTPQDRMMSPGPSSQQRRPLPPQDQVMHKTGAPSRKNSLDQDYESQHRRGYDSNNDGSIQNNIRSNNNNDSYAYESQSNKRTHSSEQGFEPWRNSGAGQNNRERSCGFNDNLSGNYNREVNTNGSKSNPAGSVQRATGYSRSNNSRRSRSRSSSRSDHTRAASYRRDNLSPRLRRTDSSHSPTPDRRSPRDDFKSHHHSPDRGRYGQHHGYDRGHSHESQYGERRRNVSSPTPADTRHTPQWTPHAPSVALSVEQAPQVYGVDETYLQQTPYHPAAAPIPYAALLANSPAFVQGLAQLTALLTPQQTPPIESLYTIASALVSEAVQTTTTTVLGPALVSVETEGLSAAGPSTPGALEGPLYVKSSPPEQASQPNNYSNTATSMPASQVTSTPLQVGGGASDALLARLSDPVTARLLQSISPFLSQIPSTNMASSQPTESMASAPLVAPQPVLSYPEPQRLDSQSGAADKDAVMSSSETNHVTSVSALSFESSENGADSNKESTKIVELLDSKPSSDSDRVQLDLKTENDMSVEATSPTLDVKDNVEEPATVTTSGNHEGILTHKEVQLGTDFVAIKPEKDSEPRIASTRDVDSSMDVTQNNERSEMDVERALMKREPSIEPYSVSLANSGSSSAETGLPGQPAVGLPRDSNTSAKATKAETTEGTSSLDESGQITMPATESMEAAAIESGLPSTESRSTSSHTGEGALEQNNVPQELNHLKEPISAKSVHESTAVMNSGMELDHALDDMTTETSTEKPRAKGTSDSESGYALVSTDMDLEEFPTVPDVENSSPGHTSLSPTDGPPGNDKDNDKDNDSSNHLENQPQLSSSPSKTFVSAHAVTQNGVRVYPSWHYVPGADMALLSEMRASTADLGRFRRETRWLEERVSRPRRDAVSEDVFDKALGLTRTIPLLRRGGERHHESQHPDRQQDQDQDHPYPRSHERANREGQHRMRSLVRAAVRVSADSRLAYSTFKAQLMEEMGEQLRLESEQTALQRAVERTETKIKLKQRLGEQAEQKMRDVLEKQAELDMELERVRKMEQEYLERREQQRRKAEDEIRQLEETLRTLQRHHPPLQH